MIFPCKGGGPGGIQGPGWRILKYKWKWKFEMEIEINQGTKVTCAALVVIIMAKAATLIVTLVVTIVVTLVVVTLVTLQIKFTIAENFSGFFSFFLFLQDVLFLFLLILFCFEAVREKLGGLGY